MHESQLDPGLKESCSYKENWENNWEIDNVGCILAKKVNIYRMLSVLMVFKCLGCHFVDNLLSNGSEKSVSVRGHKCECLL